MVRRDCRAAANVGVEAGTDCHSCMARIAIARLATLPIEQLSRPGPDHDPSAARRSACDPAPGAERRMKDSGYIAALVRGHLAANPPLTTHELAEFKAGVSVLAAFARVMARTAREAARTDDLRPDLRQELRAAELSYRKWSGACMISRKRC